VRRRRGGNTFRLKSETRRPPLPIVLHDGERVMAEPCLRREVRGRFLRCRLRLPLTLTLSLVMAKPCFAWTGERGPFALARNVR